MDKKKVLVDVKKNEKRLIIFKKWLRRDIIYVEKGN